MIGDVLRQISLKLTSKALTFACRAMVTQHRLGTKKK